MVNDKFITDGILTSLISTEQEKAIILKCGSYENATRFDCRFPSEVCSCNPVGTQVNCNCRNGNGALRLMTSEFLLPQRQGDTWIMPTKDGPIAEVQLPSMQLTVGVENYEAHSIVDASHCHVSNSPLVGCHSCERGAVFNITCTTDFGSAIGMAECQNPDIIFSVHCNVNATPESIKLNLNHPFIKTNCDLYCPASSTKFQLVGELHSPTFSEMLTYSNAESTTASDNNTTYFLDFLQSAANVVTTGIAVLKKFTTVYPLVIMGLIPLVIWVFLPTFLLRFLYTY